MAVDFHSENIMDFIISPRLSFSNDLENDKTIDNNNHSLGDSTLDFAFNVESTPSFLSSTADELFCDGKIIPTIIRKEEEEEEEREMIKSVPIMSCLGQSLVKTTPGEKNKSLKEFLEDSIEEDGDEPNTTVKSFWKFRRSNSLNSDTNQRKGLVGSWKILSRSGSTGKFLEKVVEEDESSRKSFWKFNRNNSLNSEPVNGSSKILKRSDSNNDKCRNIDAKPFRRSSSLNCETRKGIIQGSVSSTDKVLPRSYSSGSTPQKITGNTSQKRQVKSNVRWYGYGKYHENVLNLPSPYISRVSVDMFGFSMFCNGIGKDKKKKK